MAILTRKELCDRFRNGLVPSEESFRDLIESTLNKCDDDFFGRWQTNTNYYPGDVVIFKNSLYKLLPKPGTNTEVPAESKQAKKKKSSDDTNNSENGKGGDPYCENTDPDTDSRWESLIFDLVDDDWEYNIANTLVAVNTKARVGIGTKNPNGKLHIEAESSGRMVFNPTEVQTQQHGTATADPTLKIEWEPVDGCDTSYVNIRQEEGVTRLETNAECGFYFQHQSNEEEPAKLAAFRPDGAGVGTHSPKAQLDVYTQEVGHVMANPENCDEVTLRLEDKDCNQATQTVNGDFNTFQTDAARGFKFEPTAEQENKTEAAPRHVVIDQAGNMGVGTDSPACKLDVVNPEVGQIAAFVAETNPALSVVNLKPADKACYLTAGADNAFAVLKTDADCGFVFKRGEDYDPEHEVTPEKNLMGTPHVYIDQNGKVGVGAQPDKYEMDVRGKVKSDEVYLQNK